MEVSLDSNNTNNNNNNNNNNKCPIAGRSLAWIASSNPDGGMNVTVVC
jgi:hypothetical protein